MSKIVRNIILVTMYIISVACLFVILMQYRGAEWGTLDFNYPLGMKCEVTNKIIRSDNTLEISVKALKSGEPFDFYFNDVNSSTYSYLASKEIGDIVLVGNSPVFQNISLVFIVALSSLVIIEFFVKFKD